MDSIYRIGKCLVALERWPEAFIHFALLQELAPGQETSHPAKGAEEIQKDLDEELVVSGAPVLDKERVAFWLEAVQKHLSEEDKAAVDFGHSIPAPITPDPPSAGLKNKAHRKAEVDEPIHSRASLMGRDADFRWFKFVIPAELTMRNDSFMGSHELIPIDPHYTFSATQISYRFGIRFSDALL